MLEEELGLGRVWPLPLKSIFTIERCIEPKPLDAADVDDPLQGYRSNLARAEGRAFGLNEQGAIKAIREMVRQFQGNGFCTVVSTSGDTAVARLTSVTPRSSTAP